MDWELQDIQNLFTFDNIMYFLDEYADLGPIPGILLPFLEAFLPILPLIAFVMANAAAFGLWKGFVLSWIGTCLGAFVVFSLVRHLRKTRLAQRFYEYKQIKKTMAWIERHGFGPLFVMLSFPFTPSALINVVAGFSKISAFQFALSLLLGKLVMVLTVSWIGHDLLSLIKSPVKTVLLLCFIFLLWYVGKLIENKLQKRIEKRMNAEN